jgi:hypothetical protein
MSKSNPNILDKATPKTPTSAAVVSPLVPGITWSPLEDRRIAGVRKLTKAEMKLEGWDWGSATALVLDDGTLLYASQDGEGNGPGMIFGRKGGQSFYVLDRS